MAAIECMRKNYSATELKEIMNSIEEYAGGKRISLFQLKVLSPFKEEPSEVSTIDLKHAGN